MEHAQTNLCGQTPHSQICKSLINSNVLPSSYGTDTLEVCDMALSLRITFDHVLYVHGLISSMDLSSFEELARVAWADYDIQTHLGAVSTNHETCKNGFADFNMSIIY
ncbi:putative pectinesterase/pectinesterase inhibitor 6 [Bienertia sinuspersici]